MELNSAFNNSTEFRLRHIEEVPEQYRVIFAGYPYFNVVQSEVFDHILNTDKSVIVSAPTGSGKTAIFELAIVKLLIDNENVTGQDFKIIYISPMKALCEERLADWHVKFSNFGLSCISVTGDSDYFDYSALNNYNLIITTPEKWDSITRKWRENVKLVEVIKLFLIDEVHLLHEDNRGSTLEVIVSRMKTINNKMELIDKIRYVAVSATVPNIEDVAEWIGGKTNTWHHKIAEDMRPVPLKKLIFGYNFDSQNKTWFKFDLSLNYKLHNLLLQYSDGKPTLIFCSTRKSVEMTARHIKQNLTINLNPSQKEKLLQASKLIQDSNAKQTLIHGVGYHHAGLLPETKRAIEDLFRNCDLPILVTTSTLAMGVNLPAHLVIVKSTKCYTSRGYEDYPETVIMQMIGRAGRPQFDTSATAIIMTTADDKRRFENMVGGGQNVESNLHKHLDEHLNAEIVLGTIKDLGVAKHWLSTTFLYIRARKNPRYYGINPALTLDEIDKKLLDMCQIQINKLARAGMLTLDQNITITPTDVGKIMAKYCVAFETMKLFTRVNGSEGLQQILALISRSNEFSELYLRTNDKKCLNMLNKNKNNTTIRFPLNGRIKTLDMKINCIIQAVFSNLNIWDQSILADSQKIMRNGERVINCFIEYLTTRQKCFSALLHGHILSKCFKAKLWENSPFVSKQLNGIGSVFSNLLVNAGKKTFNDILQTNPRELEIILKKKSPFGSKIQDEVKHIPKYTMTLELHDKKSIKLTITLMNLDSIDEYVTGNDLSLMTLLIGDEDNNILLYEQYSHTYMMDHPTIMKFVELENLEADEISAYFISEQWVGIDCEYKLTLESKTKNGEKVKDKESPANKQSLLNMYMKVTKDINKPQKEIKRSKSPKTNCKKKKVESKSLQRTITEVFGRTIGNEKITDNDEKIITKIFLPLYLTHLYLKNFQQIQQIKP
ncbi:probable ATP-dependent DNA helicase HFM1 [Aethina tumida]|uniref:probable ATP-dependent DNA helicase HFM1 n=1 Tax=Aethina tumida TaxID=116153 RepID=UPI0021498439|nr:probable ATP-dependent DNA helicase HFM1 [Aethina tumida]